MKRLLNILLACMLLLTACGHTASSEPGLRDGEDSSDQSRDNRDDRGDRDGSDRSEGSRSEEDADRSQVSPEEGPLPAISFTHYYNSEEYADIMAFDQSGIVVWEYTTPKLEAAQLEQVEEIGLLGDSYLFTHGGRVICLNARTGEERWTNPEFKGAQSHFVVRGETVFLCGYFGPDLFVFSAKTGETIKRISTLDQDYYWPFELKLDGNQIIVSMSGGPEGDLGSDNCHYIHVNLDDWTVDPA